MVVRLYEVDRHVIDEAWHQIDGVNQQVDLEVDDEDDGARASRADPDRWLGEEILQIASGQPAHDPSRKEVALYDDGEALAAGGSEA